MKITCNTALIQSPPRECGKPAVILIVRDYEDELGRGLIAQPVCADHAPEEVHETSTSMSADEYVVVNLTAEARLEAVRKYAADDMVTTRAPYGGDLMIDRAEVLAIINGDVPALEFEGGCAS